MNVKGMGRVAGSSMLILILLALGGAEAHAGRVSPQRIESVVLTLTIDRPRYTPQEQMDITLTVHNRTRATVSYQFPTSQWYDFRVIAGTTVLWAWSHGRMFTQALTTLALAPEQSRTFNFRWDLKDNNGIPVGPGSYMLVATFPMTSAALPNAPESLSVQFSIGKSQ